MGLLVDGKWQDKWYDTKTSGGKFERSEAQDPAAKAISKQNRGAITSMSAMPAHGRTAR